MLSSLLSAAPGPVKSMFRPLKRALNILQSARRNRQVFNSMLDLDDNPLDYFSVLKNRQISEQEVLHQVNIGDVIIAGDLIGKLGLKQKVDDLCRRHFATTYQDLTQIHQQQTVEDIVSGSLQAKDSALCLQIQSSIMSRILRPHTRAYYLELQPNLRLHLPYHLVKAKEKYIEQRMGRGKLNPHGQHKDSWRYHPQNTLNVWVALTPATAENGMGVLTESQDYYAKYNNEAQEIAAGVKTYPSQQYVTDLKKGDALIFRAELLHGSIINTCEQTRVALSMRCTVDKPQFHKTHQYNYIGVKDDQFSSLSLDKILGRHDFITPSQDTEFAPAEKRQTTLQPHRVDASHIYLKHQGEVLRYPRRCPHAGADLLYGELDENGGLLCPAHRMCIKGQPCQKTNEKSNQ